MKFVYPAYVYREDDGYWAEFPDLEGAVTEGDSLVEVVDNLTEALNGYIYSSLERGIKLPDASDIMQLDSDIGKAVLILTEVDLNKSNKSVKKTLTIPEWLDVRAKAENINFSKVLQEALVEKIAK